MKNKLSAKEFIDHLELEANALFFHSVEKEGLSIRIFLAGWTGLIISICVDRSDKPEFKFWFRTNSAYYRGGSTDIHDIISVCFGIFLKRFKFSSCNLFDVPHPAVSLLSRFEIYARYLAPVQRNPELCHLDKESLEEYKKLIVYVKFFELSFWHSFGGCPCNDCRDRLGIKYEFNSSIDKVLFKRIVKTIGKAKYYNHIDRQLPTWNYYRDFDRHITIIESIELSSFLTNLVDQIDCDVLQAVDGILLINNNIKNFISYQCIEHAQEIIGELELIKNIKIRYTCIDNIVVFISKKFIVFFEQLCGIHHFKLEREKLRLRHNKEFKLLFSPSDIIWNNKIDEELFEDLIYDLLQREESVIWVRKVAHTNEADGGRDLIAAIKVGIDGKSYLNENVSPFVKKKIIVQCKAYKNGVGKSDVTDIRDTIDFCNSDGFLLVVSSYLKRNLTENLEKIREKYWVDWWARQEINEKLKNNPDLIIKYSQIFSN